LLNPVIRGWADYHKHQVAKETFNKVDSTIWKQLWQWACRRHPNKPRKWIKDKYFMSEGLRNWVFGSRVKIEDGNVKKVALVKASETPICRHTKMPRKSSRRTVSIGASKSVATTSLIGTTTKTAALSGQGMPPQTLPGCAASPSALSKPKALTA
jgi:hypothetical protein